MSRKKLLKSIVVVIAVVAFIAMALEVFGVYSGLFAVVPYRVPGKPTELMRAAAAGDVDAIQRLLARGVDINRTRGYSTRWGVFVVHGPSPDRYGETALLFAIDGGKHDAVRLLLDRGADATVVDSYGKGMWDHALGNPRGSQLLMLLAQRFPLPVGAADGMLYFAGMGDEQLLEYALSLQTSESARESAFCSATGRGDIPTMDRLLPTLSRTPQKSLECAFRHGNMNRSTIEYLLSHGADPNGSPESLEPPLSLLLDLTGVGRDSHTLSDTARDMFELLLSRGADPRLVRPPRTIGNVEYHRATVSPIEVAHARGYDAAAKFLEAWPAVPAKLAPVMQPLICVKSDQLQGCLGTAPASSTSGDDDGPGFWIRGSGPEGRPGSDGRFDITLRQHSVDMKLVECSVTVDGTTSGSLSPACGKSFGSVKITVTVQQEHEPLF